MEARGREGGREGAGGRSEGGREGGRRWRQPTRARLTRTLVPSPPPLLETLPLLRPVTWHAPPTPPLAALLVGEIYLARLINHHFDVLQTALVTHYLCSMIRYFVDSGNQEFYFLFFSYIFARTYHCFGTVFNTHFLHLEAAVTYKQSSHREDFTNFLINGTVGCSLSSQCLICIYVKLIERSLPLASRRTHIGKRILFPA